MNAGRELDALIAEKVMGWDMTRPTGFKYPWGMPRYSTDIAAAWKVLEKFDPQEWSYDLRTYDVPGPEAWRCAILRWDKIHPFFRGDDAGIEYAVTAPLAICLAALAAVTVAEA